MQETSGDFGLVDTFFVCIRVIFEILLTQLWLKRKELFLSGHSYIYTMFFILKHLFRIVPVKS